MLKNRAWCVAVVRVLKRACIVGHVFRLLLVRVCGGVVNIDNASLSVKELRCVLKSSGLFVWIMVRVYESSFGPSPLAWRLHGSGMMFVCCL